MSVGVLVGTVALQTVDVRAAGTGSMSGVVTGPDNAGIADLTVVASPFDGSPGDVVTTTDSTGHYTIIGLGTGDYRVTFADPRFGVVYYPGTPDFSAAVPVAVRDGIDTPGIDQHYTATGGIRGTVTSEVGGTIAGASVMVTRRDGVGGGSATTGSDGAYAVTGLTDGAYTVHASDAGHLSMDYPNVVTVSRGGVVAGVDVVLPLAGSITGRVAGPDGTPAAGVLVSASFGAVTVPTVTAPDGTYTIDTLGTAAYLVSFTIAGESTPVEYYDDAADVTGASPVAVTVGATTSGIDAALGPDPSLGGTVRGAGDVPLAGATVTVTPQVGAPRTATTGAGGTYLFSRLPDGTYSVSFSAPGYLEHTADAPVHVAKHHPAFGVDARLKPTASIAGNVSSLAGTPIVGATIDVRDASGAGGTATSDAAGNYVVTSLAKGKYVVHFSAAGYVDQFVEVSLHEGEQAGGIDARLDPGATITGTFLDASGGTLPGDLAVVTCLVPAVPAAGGCAGEHGTTEPLAGQVGPASPGVATRVGVPPGLYAVAGTDGATVSTPAPITAVSGGQIVCTFRFTASGASSSCDDGVNDSPDAVDDQAAVVEGFGPATIDILGNDNDPNGDALQIVSATGADHGGTVDCTAQSCTYLPSPYLPVGPDGALDRFGYTVSDGALSDSATVNVSVSANATTTEGDQGGHRVDMTAVLSSREHADQPVFIVYCVRAGTARRRDVSLGCAHTHVAPGADRVALPVWVKGDRRVEDDEYAIVDVTAYGGTLWDRHLTLVIRDDDGSHDHHPHHGRY